jgi:hypothetical protein
MLAPVAALKRANVMCVALPTPLVATVMGVVLLAATNSATVLAATSLLKINTCGT